MNGLEDEPRMPSTSDSALSAAQTCIATGYRAMLRRSFREAQAAFVEAFRLLKDVPGRRAYLLVVESLVKVAECKLSTGQYGSCANLCSFLFTKEPRLQQPGLRHRLHLVRGLAAAGQSDWGAAGRDLEQALALCPAHKMRAMTTIMQHVDNLQRAAEGQSPQSSATSCTTILDLAAGEVQQPGSGSEGGDCESCSMQRRTPYCQAAPLQRSRKRKAAAAV